MFDCVVSICNVWFSGWVGMLKLVVVVDCVYSVFGISVIGSVVVYIVVFDRMFVNIWLCNMWL